MKKTVEQRVDLLERHVRSKRAIDVKVSELIDWPELTSAY
jgi:hypothetical protein